MAGTGGGADARLEMNTGQLIALALPLLLVQLGLMVERNTTISFPAPLMSTVEELGAFLTREKAAAASPVVAHSSNGGAVTGAGR